MTLDPRHRRAQPERLRRPGVVPKARIAYSSPVFAHG
jgi:hypothetical protein